MSARIAVIGGGVSGITAALHLAETGYEVTLYEKRESLVSGPPFCHLHAGGNLYREIDDEQCRNLLRQSLDFAARYPFCVDRRPTLIAVPLDDDSDAQALLPRLRMLRATYADIVRKDPARALLGDPDDYFATIDRERFEALRNKPVKQNVPDTDEAWMIAAARLIDPQKVHFPLILVREYGLNLFRLAAGATLMLRALPNVTLRLGSEVTHIAPHRNGWSVRTGDGEETVCDYIVNAAGFRTGTIDEMVGLKNCRRMVEFKAAYVARWQHPDVPYFPEMIFHGKRGTPRGMGQFTPYAGGYVQLHAMRKDVTLYEEGLVSAPPGKCQPPLSAPFVEKIERGWKQNEVEERTRRAVEHLARFVPDFSTAQTGAVPLFGAQQIPGDDPELRVAEISFALPRYARCEIVKVSSAVDMAEALLRDIEAAGLSPSSSRSLVLPDETQLDTLARKIALAREYPESMACRLVS
jgi:glycine/D-amino acid oxidase-like deaminating enzyme